MLICPQCQRENPNHNKFCQSCGTSLTQKVCAACGTKVRLNEKQCPNCRAETGPIWLAIISATKDFSDAEKQRSQRRAGVSPVEATGVGKGVEESVEQNSLHLRSAPSPPSFLDPQQRYQLLEPLPSLLEITTNTAVQVRLLDCQPFQLSPLAVNGSAIAAITTPMIAKPYLALQSQLNQMLPAVHDAWQQEEMQVVLVADRSHWREFLELWHDRSTTALQIWQWMSEMTRLWAVLEPWHCRQSLLELSNLRVDRHGNLGLQRLYTELPAVQPLVLSDLGQVWQRLFQESQKTKFGSLVELFTELQTDQIQTIAQLRSRLQAVVDQLQVPIKTLALQPKAIGDNSQAAATTTGEVTATLKDSAANGVLPMDEPQDSLKSEDLSPTVVLPMQLISLEDAGDTNVGRQRNHNEDCFGIETAINKVEFPNSLSVQARGIYILCDGMGGHAGGEVASRLAVKTLQQYFQTHWQSHMPLPDEDSIREAVRLANQAIYDLNQQDARSGVGRMGTTLVLVLLQNNQVAVAHVGDSRLYRLNHHRGLEQVTLDHEVGQREILRGVEPEIAYARPDAYQLTQALGPRDENYVHPDVQFFELNEDTLLLLASDGLTDYDLIEHHWQTHLESLLSSGVSLQQGVSNLIELANEHNGHDNITAIVIRTKVRPSLEQQ